MKNRLLTTVGVVTLLLLAEGAWVYAFLPHPADATRNSAGTVSLATSPVVSNQVIGSALWNNTFGGLRQDVEDSLDRSGRGGMLAQLALVNGSSTTPAIGFTSETTAGLFRNAAGDLRMTFNGTIAEQWTINGARVADGAVATPGLSFFNDTGSGLYRIGSNNIGFAINGTKRQDWTTAGSTVFGLFGANSPASTLSASLTSKGTSSATLTNFTQNVSNNALAIETLHTDSNYYPGLIWFSSDSNATKPKAGIYIQAKTTGSIISIGTSNNYGTGITANTTIDQDGNLAAPGIVTAAEFLCSSFGASGTRCGNGSLNGSGDATITVVAGLHGCVCTTAVVAAPAALGCNVSGTTLTLKGGANATFNYLCF